MLSIWFEIFLIIFLIILNGVFALSELALISARKARLEQWSNEGDWRARIALELANSPDSFLSTIQIGITFIGILTGAFGGAIVAELLEQYLSVFPLIAPYGEAVSVAIVVVCITYLSLIIGELVPKRLALNNPERLARLVAPSIRRLSRLAHPLVVLLGGSTKVLLGILRVKPSSEPAVTEEEIKLLIDQGTQAGTFQAFEQDMIGRVFRLADRKVAVLMTPRTDIVWLDLNDSEEKTRRKIAQHKHAVFPVGQDSIDNITGIVRSKDLLSHLMESKSFNLREVSRKPLFVSEMTPALKVFELFKKTGTHIALVVDEYGSIQGLVTFGDILRSVFEDIEESAEGEKEIVEREDGSWLISGSVPLDEFIDFMELGKIEEEEKAGMNTLGGFVMVRIGAVPSEGQHFEWKGLRFEVVDMDDRRVDKVLVTKTEDPLLQEAHH